MPIIIIWFLFVIIFFSLILYLQVEFPQLHDIKNEYLEDINYKKIYDDKYGIGIENDFGLKIFSDESVIMIDDIVIFYIFYGYQNNHNVWKHKTPIKMKFYVIKELKKLNIYEKQYSDSALEHKKEKDYLYDKFNKK